MGLDRNHASSATIHDSLNKVFEIGRGLRIRANVTCADQVEERTLTQIPTGQAVKAYANRTSRTFA